MHDVTVGDSLRSYEVYATLLLVACAAVAEGVFFIFFFFVFCFCLRCFSYVVNTASSIYGVVGWCGGGTTKSLSIEILFEYSTGKSLALRLTSLLFACANPQNPH